MVAPEPIEAPCRTVGTHFQSASVWRLPSGIGRPRKAVVDESHAVADEDFIFNRHALANKAVAGNLAPLADARAFLDFNKRPDFWYRPQSRSRRGW